MQRLEDNEKVKKEKAQKLAQKAKKIRKWCFYMFQNNSRLYSIKRFNNLFFL